MNKLNNPADTITKGKLYWALTNLINTNKPSIKLIKYDETMKNGKGNLSTKNQRLH